MTEKNVHMQGSRDQVATHCHLRRKPRTVDIKSSPPSMTKAIWIHEASSMSVIMTPMVMMMMIIIMMMAMMVMMMGVSCFIKHFLNMLGKRLFLYLSYGFWQWRYKPSNLLSNFVCCIFLRQQNNISNCKHFYSINFSIIKDSKACLTGNQKNTLDIPPELIQSHSPQSFPS